MNSIGQILLNPAIISLVGGYVAYSIHTAFSLPGKLVDLISIYLIFAIGFKGGACLGVANECTPPLFALAALGVAVGFMQPFLHYVVLKRTTKLDSSTAGVVAAEYGSISIITFITAITFLQEHVIPYDRFMTVIAGIMELPALLSGLWLVKHNEQSSDSNRFQMFMQIARAIAGSIKIMIIFVGFFVGYLFQHLSYGHIDTAILAPFTLCLILFMFDMGCKIARQREHIYQFSLPLIAFGLYIPIINGITGLFLARLFIESIGSQLLFAVLLASASYIAVPAVMSMQVPEAKEGVYLPLSLGITLPFNILIGIPLYYYIALLF